MFHALLLLTIVGHFAVCILFINRLHATALPYWLLKGIDKLWYLFLFLTPLAVIAWWLTAAPTDLPATPIALRWLMIAYGVVCGVALFYVIPTWLSQINDRLTTTRLASNHTKCIDVGKKSAEPLTHGLVTSALSALPTNQVFDLYVHEKEIRLPRLPATLDGLSIAHLSDLHFTGRVTKPFFEEVVLQTQELEPDIIAITGDIIDKPKCLPWLTDVLGKLSAPHGVFFVLGNHDLRIRDEAAVRDPLCSNGHVDLGGRWTMVEVNDEPIILAGNELPWWVPAADMSECPQANDGKRPFRIALSHSARSNQVGSGK